MRTNRSFLVDAPAALARRFEDLMARFKTACVEEGFNFYADPNWAYECPEIADALNTCLRSYPGEVGGQMHVADGKLKFRITPYGVGKEAA